MEKTSFILLACIIKLPDFDFNYELIMKLKERELVLLGLHQRSFNRVNAAPGGTAEPTCSPDLKRPENAFSLPSLLHCYIIAAVQLSGHFQISPC